MLDVPAPHQNGLLIWIGGVASTVAGSWLTGRIRAYQDDKQAHLVQIKEEILKPIRDGIAERFLPLLTYEDVPFAGKYQQVRSSDSPNVLEPAFQEHLQIVPTTPTYEDLVAKLPRGLLQDARWKHYPVLFDEIGSFIASWKKVAEGARVGVAQM